MSLAHIAARRLLWAALSVIVLASLLALLDAASAGFQERLRELKALQGAQGMTDEIVAQERAAAEDALRKLGKAPAEALRARVAELDAELTRLRALETLRSMSPAQIAFAAAGGDLPRLIRQEVQVELRHQERSAVLALLSRLEYRTLAQRRAEVERQRDAAYREREAAKAIYDAARARMGRIEHAVAPVFKTADARAADAAHANWWAAIRRHRALYEEAALLAQRADGHSGRTVSTVFSPALDDVRATVKGTLSSAAATVQEKIDASWLQRMAQALSDNLGNAFAILASGGLFFLAWKACFFYGIARWIEKRPPIQLEPGSAILGGEPLSPRSQVSLRLDLGAQEELLVKGAYLQDSPVNARASTRLLLDPAFPFASLASGMHGLTCIGGASCEGPVTVSSTNNPMEELSEIRLSTTEGFVLSPRYLVGVVQDPRAPVRIRSVWRLGSLHAWLTGQLRYLVFSGSGQLIVGGCRGVRVERPDERRRISRSATVGFSAGLQYSTGRTETFIPYLLGVKPLFYDSFSGNGFYAYQEVAASPGGGGTTEGRLMGLVDLLLKPFGI